MPLHIRMLTETPKNAMILACMQGPIGSAQIFSLPL